MRRLAVLSAMLVCAPHPSAAATLADSILAAVQTNPALRAQRADLRALEEGYVQARAGFGPQIALTAQGGYDVHRVQSGPFLFSGASDTTYRAATGSADLSLVQPLYTSGAARAQARSANDDVRAGRQSVRTAESRLIQSVIAAYVDVRRDREALRILQDEIADVTRTFDEAKAKGQLGQLSRTDVAQARARLLSAQARLHLAQGRLSASNAEFVNVVGENPGDLEAEPTLAGMPDTVDAAFSFADRNNPQLLAAIEAERAAREKVNQAKSAFGATVSIKIDAAVAPVEPYLQGEYARGVTGAVVVNQPIFTSGLNSSKVREAVDRDTAAQLDVENTRRGVVQQVAQAWSQLLATRNAVRIESQQVEAEREALEGNQVEEKVGLRTTIELLNAELELADSRVELLQSRRDQYVAGAAVLAAMGRLEVGQLFPEAARSDNAEAQERSDRAGSPWAGVVEAIDGLGAPRTVGPEPSVAGAGGLRPADLPAQAKSEP